MENASNLYFCRTLIFCTQGRSQMWTWGRIPPFLKKKNYQYINRYSFQYFCSIKLQFTLLNTVIDSFKSNVITTNFSTTFLQTIEVENSYQFAHLHHFLLTNNYLPHQQFVIKKKKKLQYFPLFKGHKKINRLNLKQNLQTQKNQPNNKNYQ